jgi:type II restriction enzyme
MLFDVRRENINKWSKIIKDLQEYEKGKRHPNTIEKKDTQSQKLRENLNQHTPKNIKSKKQDSKIVKVVKRVMDELSVKYPNLKFEYDKRLFLKDLIVSLKKGNPNFDFEDVLITTHIKPDGGVIYMIKDDIKHPILVSEGKRQGTNDVRLSEGLSKQSKGNAVERLAKNVKVIELLFSNEKINPLVVFLQGCDFHPTETIVDRVKSIFHFLKQNQINLYKKKLGDINVGGSYFMKGNKAGSSGNRLEWSENEMYDAMIEVADKSVEYYLTKYYGEQ